MAVPGTVRRPWGQPTREGPLYQAWDADRGTLLSSGHRNVESAVALMGWVQTDVARHAHLGNGEITLCLEIRDSATGEAVATACSAGCVTA
ncbi:hypothetical protein GCM10009800_46860 [Nocardiopsis rhodophaea]